MKSKQEKLKKLLLTKRLMMAAALSVVMGATTAVACTHVDKTTSNGCPIVGSKLDRIDSNVVSSMKDGYYVYTTCLKGAKFPYGFDVYKAIPGGILPAKGQVTGTWVSTGVGDNAEVICTLLLDSFQGNVQLQSVSSVTWVAAPPGLPTGYNPSSYLGCCQPGT